MRQPHSGPHAQAGAIDFHGRRQQDDGGIVHRRHGVVMGQELANKTGAMRSGVRADVRGPGEPLGILRRSGWLTAAHMCMFTAVVVVMAAMGFSGGGWFFAFRLGDVRKSCLSRFVVAASLAAGMAMVVK